MLSSQKVNKLICTLCHPRISLGTDSFQELGHCLYDFTKYLLLPNLSFLQVQSKKGMSCELFTSTFDSHVVSTFFYTVYGILPYFFLFNGRSEFYNSVDWQTDASFVIPYLISLSSETLFLFFYFTSILLDVHQLLVARVY